MLLDRSSHHELLQILDNDRVFRAHVQEAKTVYKAHIRRLREESAEMEEAPFTLPTTPEPSRNHQYDPSVQIHTYRRPRRFATADINNGRSSASDEARYNARVNTALLPQHPWPRPQSQIQQNAQNRNLRRVLQAADRNGNGVHLQFLNGVLIFRWVGTGNELQIDMEGAMVSIINRPRFHTPTPFSFFFFEADSGRHIAEPRYPDTILYSQNCHQFADRIIDLVCSHCPLVQKPILGLPSVVLHFRCESAALGLEKGSGVMNGHMSEARLCWTDKR
ncbi:hypothetical protein N8I77_002038 [Diaporthe amygdali]|uniref:Uncharacterized protein n=1 Tax=Phomopsis amygdali TaxID=1214568 RepID=A0AAD9WA01_PHOAM|nr:hypothetical protein N8I77_002038 [Diaporthe amygdali]